MRVMNVVFALLYIIQYMYIASLITDQKNALLSAKKPMLGVRILQGSLHAKGEDRMQAANLL